ncbi:MAG TPA: hypothetical protein PLH64_02705 [Anaerolineaceae bacterium]|nr:hypothetical protein [Anaerolineaceae bacterium]
MTKRFEQSMFLPHLKTNNDGIGYWLNILSFYGLTDVNKECKQYRQKMGFGFFYPQSKTGSAQRKKLVQ